MIDFKEFYLENGLQVIVHSDHSTPIVCLNTLYKVGSRNEQPTRTGFAHLFEHLMFGGSANIPLFDEPLQAVGGDNNAFTTTDYTNYYTTVPAINVETAFWLESDRMLSLSFDPQTLQTQQSVVIEEFKQRYLNQPYGDCYLKLRPLAYHVHPYRWATIGMSIEHIAEATLSDVKDFFYTYYHPSNAILVVAGDITFSKAQQLCEKWYGPIAKGQIKSNVVEPEPQQMESRFQKIYADVPQEAIYKVFHMPGKVHTHFPACDLLADILGRGKSSLLYQYFVKEKKWFSTLSASVAGTIDPGWIIFQGKITEGVDVLQADEELTQFILSVTEKLRNEDLVKVKNMSVSSLYFSEVELLNRAMNLAFAAFCGNSHLVNEEPLLLQKTSIEDVSQVATCYLQSQNMSTLIYQKK